MGRLDYLHGPKVIMIVQVQGGRRVIVEYITVKVIQLLAGDHEPRNGGCLWKREKTREKNYVLKSTKERSTAITSNFSFETHILDV